MLYPLAVKRVFAFYPQEIFGLLFRLGSLLIHRAHFSTAWRGFILFLLTKWVHLNVFISDSIALLKTCALSIITVLYFAVALSSLPSQVNCFYCKKLCRNIVNSSAVPKTWCRRQHFLLHLVLLVLLSVCYILKYGLDDKNFTPNSKAS